MGLGLPTGGAGGDRTPVIKYDGRAGRLFRVDRSNASGSWVTDNVEIPADKFSAVFDLDNIETGWLHFPSGGAPDIRTAKVGTPIGDKPSDLHRAGFKVHMLLAKSCGGDLREMAANAQVAIKGMDALYDAFVAGRAANPGKLPVVSLEKTVAVKSSGKDAATGKPVESTNYQPVWKIDRWVDRPAGLGGAPASGAAEQQPEPPPPPPPVEDKVPELAGDGIEF
jgi:hypothetical protein